MEKGIKKEVLGYKNKIITRTMFCAVCAELQMPRMGNVVILFGQSSQKYHPFSIKKDQEVKEYGFTPHAIKMTGLHSDNNEELVTFEKSCCMNGCGLEVQFTDSNKGVYEVWTIQENFDWMPLMDFYNLIHFKEKSYYLFAK